MAHFIIRQSVILTHSGSADSQKQHQHSLQELERISVIPTDKPTLVSCASGYRSATPSSMTKKPLPGRTSV